MITPRRGAILALILFGLVIALGPLIARTGRAITDTATFDGEAYRTALYYPAVVTPGAPLILVLHGYGGSIRSLENDSDLSTLAEDGFGVLYVGAGPDAEGQSYWNANLDPAGRDDLSALVGILHDVQVRYGFDPDRTFVIGQSNGGFMAYSLACRTQDVVAGFVSVIGTMSGLDWETCAPGHPVPLLHMDGALDDVVPRDGSMSRDGGWGGAPDAETVVASWAARFGDVTKKTSRPEPGLTVTTYTTPDGRLAARRLAFDTLGHDWPEPDYVALDVMPMIRTFLDRAMNEAR